MLKGVNKQVVEVVEVDNEFFERAILFVKPEKQQNGEEALRENARRYVGSLRWRPRQPGFLLKATEVEFLSPRKELDDAAELPAAA